MLYQGTTSVPLNPRVRTGETQEGVMRCTVEDLGTGTSCMYSCFTLRGV